jgi:glycosyltransferase involved in cell wall biosynthesis
MSRIDLEIHVCIVVYNEEKRIIECLTHVKNAIEFSEFTFNAHVIVNGSTDNTMKLVEAFCEANASNFKSYEIVLGDKSNAWNFFTYEVNVNNCFAIHIDGDCFVSINSLDDMAKYYCENDKVNSISGFPATNGRETSKWRMKLLEQGGIPGNFYALTPKFLKKIKSHHFHLPIGLIGDDSLLNWVAGCDFSIKNERKRNNFGTCLSALFYFERFIPDSLGHLKLYVRRLRRYSLRRIQLICIRGFLNQGNDFKDLPVDLENLYPYGKKIFFKLIRLDPINIFFDIKHYFFLVRKS